MINTFGLIHFQNKAMLFAYLNKVSLGGPRYYKNTKQCYHPPEILINQTRQDKYFRFFLKVQR